MDQVEDGFGPRQQQEGPGQMVVERIAHGTFPYLFVSYDDHLVDFAVGYRQGLKHGRGAFFRTGRKKEEKGYEQKCTG